MFFENVKKKKDFCDGFRVIGDNIKSESPICVCVKEFLLIRGIPY